MLRHDNATHLPRARGGLERRIRDAETHLFDAVGADVDQFFVDLARTRLRVRVIAHGRGPTVLLLHGVSESAAVWAPLFPKLRHLRVLAVDLPGHGLSDPISFQHGEGAPDRPLDRRRHPRRIADRPRAGDRPLPRRHVRPVASRRRFHTDLGAGGDRSARRRARRHPCPDTPVTADGPRAGRSRLACTQPTWCLSSPARPRPRHLGRRSRTRPADRGATSIRTAPRQRQNRRLR